MKHIRIYEDFDFTIVPKIGDYICQERWIREYANRAGWNMFYPIMKVIGGANKYDYILCEYIKIDRLSDVRVSLHDEIRFATPEEIEEYELKKSALIYNL